MVSPLEQGINDILQNSKEIEFTKEDVKSVLMELKLTMESETDKMALDSDFVLQKNKIIFTFPNSVLAEKLGEYKALIHEHISKVSGFSTWEIVTEISVEESKAKIYKTQDKFEAMKSKNPILSTFKEAFNLDLDF